MVKWLWMAVLVAAEACGGASAACPSDLPAACPATPPSFAGQVSPIVQRTCAQCHRPGGVAADRPLTSYAEITAQRGVLDQVYGCRMPPSSAPQLQPAERKALLEWLVCKAPEN